MCVSTIEWNQEILPHVCFYYRMDSLHKLIEHIGFQQISQFILDFSNELPF